MERTLTRDLSKHLGQRVELQGWMHTLRGMGGVSFMLLRDRSGLAQVVVNDVSSLESCLPETVLRVRGIVHSEPRARAGVELRDAEIEVISCVRAPLPFEINKGPLKAHLDTFLDHAPIGLRHPQRQAVFRLASALRGAYESWMRAHDFTQIISPKLVGVSTEGGANLFRVEYFGKSAYLAQSPQLYKQMMVGVFERVFEIGQVYRAEPHYTTRHINEYTSLDMEMGFIRDYTDVMSVLTQVLGYMFEWLREEHSADLETAGTRLPAVRAVPVLDFHEAQQLLHSRYREPLREDDLSPSQERRLCEWAEGEGSDFVFVTGYPLSKRPFYTMPDPRRPGQTNSFDLLFRGVEIVTGGQRRHEYDDLVQSIWDRGYSPESFAAYLEAFRYGVPPEGGFAIGSERLLARLVGADNVRETALFPRDVNRLTP